MRMVCANGNQTESELISLILTVCHRNLLGLVMCIDKVDTY